MDDDPPLLLPCDEDGEPIRPRLNTTNTPFEGLPRDLCELLLDLLDTPSVFNLMLVNHNSKAIAYSEHHWKKRLRILFSPQTILRYRSKMRHFRGDPESWRLLTVALINRQYSIEDLSEAILARYPSHENYISFSQDGVDIFNQTFGAYMKTLYMQPLDEFERLVIEELPDIYFVNIINFRDDVLRIYRSKASRFGIVLCILVILATIHRYYGRTFQEPLPVFEMTAESFIIAMHRMLMNLAIIDSPFKQFMAKLINVERYPYLEDVD